MALNPNAVGKTDSESTETNDSPPEGSEAHKNSSATANQNGDQPGCRDSVMPEQEALERRRSMLADARSSSSYPSPAQRSNEELPRRNFQIPRKTRERKGLYQFLAPDSREFEDLVKIISSFYLDSSSRGSFSYCKARLIHNELLEKEFIEKRREMKQAGRTEPELAESYCFLFPDKSKLQWICEKGLSLGHCRIMTLGNPSMGVYLSKYSDLLQMNPFEAGSFGDMIIFKVMRGKIKHIHENMPKNAIEPSTKFDCHLSKSANRVTSLLSYRAFELTQQYFFEFAFDEIKTRPRHVCPYAIVSFQYKGKEAAAAPMTAHRFNTISMEGSRGKSCYTVWSGPLVNKGQELFPVSLRSFSRAYLPHKLPEKLEMNRGMQLDQVKRKLPSFLFSWDTYSISREVMKFGMSCSLFDVVEGKGKATSGSLASLIHKLERDRMVLVKSLHDRGFLFLLSSAQMVESKERRGRVEKKLQALFIFQESRTVVKYSSRLSEPELLKAEPQPAALASTKPFIPALHYSFFKLRPNPGKDLSSGVERQMTDYLTRMESGMVRPFILPDYKSSVDERTGPLLVPRSKFNMEAVLRSYVHNSANYVLPLNKAKDLMERIRNPVPVPAPVPPPAPVQIPVLAPVEYSPVSDWGGSDRGSDRADRPSERLSLERPPQEKPPPEGSKQRTSLTHSNGAQLQPKPHAEPQPQLETVQLSQSEYDQDKMKQLLKLIQLHKKTLVKDRGDDGAWDANSLKRKFEEDERVGSNKHQRMDHASNGEPSRAFQTDELGAEAEQSDSLTAVMESIGIYDTDLRARGNANASAVNETQRLLKILLATLNKAVGQNLMPTEENHGESSTASVSGLPELAFEKPRETASQVDYTEEDMDCSPASPFSVGSPPQQAQASDALAREIPTTEGASTLLETAQPSATPKPEPEAVPPADSEPEPKKTPTVLEVQKAEVPPLTVPEEVSFRPSISLDTIVNQEIHSLTSNIKNLMQTRHMSYTSQLPPRLPLRHCWQPNTCFSSYVVPFVTPVSTDEHVQALCERMNKLIPDPPAPSSDASPPPSEEESSLTTPPPPTSQTSKTKAELLTPKGANSSQSSKTDGINKETVSTKAKADVSSAEVTGEVYSPSRVTADSPESHAQNANAAPGVGSNLLAGSLISQLKPEVFTSLVEIFKDVTKNTVKFYIYSVDEGEEGSICQQIKEYLKSLGNSECSPQTFLENSSRMDKLLIIIRNEDIATHVHKIPALVSLKKLPSVSFAGVDSLDDVKNHTYNELFVSGGFMVSDEFVLNPDLITQDRLQGLLKFLEEQSTPEHPWQWKVHCKSQKKLKELGRLNINAMGLLNLLTIYQKKHLVEFLPYHECDTASRQAPDLECLIKLQAQNTQQRHLIFLTERPFEMFLQYSRNGIVIASIDDVMSGFHSLIGSINQNELPTPPSTVVNDECVEEEDMSLDSDDGEPTTTSEPTEQVPEVEKEESVLPPPPEMEEFRPPLPDQQSTPEKTPTLADCTALKTAISQFKVTNQIGLASSDLGSLSPGGFPVNTHQSFLCPSTPWSSYTGSSGYVASPAYPASPCSSTQEQEYRVPNTASSAVPTQAAIATAGPLANLASLPMEVKPPPPPHLMMQGRTYGSDAAGATPLNPTLPYKNPSDAAQMGYMGGGTPVQQDRTVTRPGEAGWNATQTTTCETASSQSVVTSRPHDPSSLPTTGEVLVGSTPGCQGGKTQVNCAENLGASVGIPPVATRGSCIPRPKLPPPPVVGVGYGVGGLPAHVDHGALRGAMVPGSLGGFRGRGVPPVGLLPRPRQELGNGTGVGPCSWAYPGGRGGTQNYYTDYTYSHNYAPE
uniref:Family with sequence similarity 208, member Ab n=1 Tax=Nothobranchius kuhntae TaxID=321403 RepID=A0A1A8HRF4_NOTKU